jgi:hypothetical protein
VCRARATGESAQTLEPNDGKFEHLDKTTTHPGESVRLQRNITMVRWIASPGTRLQRDMTAAAD